jgi:Gas vesicle synthesis protein GvpL/GvpF
VLHVYAITDSAPDLEAVGLDGAELRTVGDEAPFAVVSEHARLSTRLDEGDLWAHEAVVEELMDRATVLPMRFDGAVDDEATLRRILDERREEFETLLGSVRGAVELGVRAQVDEEEPVSGDDPHIAGSGGSGTAYLLARARDQRAAAGVATRIHGPLAALARQSRRSGRSLRPGLFKAAYLVERDGVDPFRARVEALGSELGGGRIVCTGPWPPYSFSSKENT